ncbi:DUF4839 domain-containing protein [Streptococcus ovuberis]|uniref:DUF4839 domain-containing protein n=1 Tax=Streptococcus ovuberis TaxID=1936207 RepID=A0A7X6MZ73_9STRE|nr:DUF4839 domain-containing protein [Streptococcus ovuberis]NKZ21145.1 DUF4839 domain-containing protein [Streptococcus ovuberis]
MAIFKGKTVNEAIENGLNELQIDKKHADITVLQEPSNGVLGVFKKEAEVEIVVLSDEDLEKRAQKKMFEKILAIGLGILFILMFVVIPFLSNETDDSKETESKTSPSSMTTVIEKKEKMTTTVSKTTEADRTTKETTTSTTVQRPTVLTIENNPEFAAILNSESGELAQQFADKYYGITVEFDGHIAYIAPHENYKTRYDILLYGGDYSGSESTNYSGVNLQFFDVATTSDAFSSLDSLSIGQNVHIKAQVVEYNAVSGLLRLEPVQITAR